METLRKLTKAEILYNLFSEVGNVETVENILAITEIRTLGQLKFYMWYLRNSERIPVDKRIDIRLRAGECIRV